MLIRFWGVRGSIPVPGETTVQYGGNTPCVSVEHDGRLVIIDCGTGLRVLGQHLMSQSKGGPIKAHILISHAHWDHIQGFPFFTPAFIPGNGFDIYGAQGLDEHIKDIFSGQMRRPYFPVGLEAMGAELGFNTLGETSFDIGGLNIVTCALNHPGGAMGFRISDGNATFVYLSDHEPFYRMMTTPTSNPVAIEFPEDDTEIPTVATQKDTKYTKFCKDADLLIIDSPYTVDEYATRVGWGHACIDDAVEIAGKSRVGNLVLFHHEPTHDDRQMDDIVNYCAALAREHNVPVVVGAREGLEIEL